MALKVEELVDEEEDLIDEVEAMVEVEEEYITSCAGRKTILGLVSP